MKPLVSLASLFALVSVAAAAAPVQAQCQGSNTILAQARGGLAAVTVGDLALFAGGRLGSVIHDEVDLYYGATDAWAMITLPTPRVYMGGTAVGDLALFAGGGVGPTTTLNVVDVLDTQSLIWTLGVPLTQSRQFVAATTVGTKAFFAGGERSSGAVSARVDIYDSSLGTPDEQAAWSMYTLPQARAQIAAVTVGTYAIFAGGVDPSADVVFAHVDIYNDATGLWAIAALSQARSLGSSAAAVSNGNRAYFGGGQLSGSGTMSNVVDVFDAQTGTFLTPLILPVARGQLAAAVAGECVLFAGGLENGFVTSSVVDRLDTGTGQWSAGCNLLEARWSLGAATVGGKAVFAGGGIGQNDASDVVDIFLPDVGTSYCLSTANSTGTAATISATGSSSVAANDLELTAGPVPNQPGVFFYGPTQIQQPFGNGFLCIGTGATGIARLPVVFATGNVLAYAVDNSTPPTPGTQILPGSRWNFSAWYRDPAGLGSFFNLSDGLSIQFTP